MARPRKEIDYEQINLLCQFGCPANEIVARLNLNGADVSYQTIERRIREDYGVSFGEYIAQKHDASFKPRLRELQVKAAEKLNPSILIWLGKNVLGQREPALHDNDVSPETMAIAIKAALEAINDSTHATLDETETA